MMAGFYAQQNSYGIELGSICGGGSSACAPLGQGGQQLFLAASSGAQGKKSLYDITSGCTTNEVGSGFCAITGYDRATGWGTPNMLQFAWANNYWNMPEASPPVITMSGPSTSGWVNGGSISWSIVDAGSPASGGAGYTAAWDADPGDPSSMTTPGSGNSYYSGPASAHGATSGSTGLLTGCHTLFVRAWDNIGESAVNSYGTVCYDGTAPSVSDAQVHFRNNRAITLNGAQASVRVSWTASDSLSGLGNALVWQSVDGAAFTQIATTAASFYDTAIPVGHNYEYAVGVFDNAGNFGGYTFSPNMNLKIIQENAAAVVYTPGWNLQHLGSASAKRTEWTKLASKSATVTFSGNEVAWVSYKDTTRGSAHVSLDGGATTGVNTHASSATPRIVVYTATTSNGSHTLQVTNVGTAGSPRIDVDAFLVLKPV